MGQHLAVFLLAIAAEVFDHSAGQKIQLDSLFDFELVLSSIILKLNEKNEINALLKK